MPFGLTDEQMHSILLMAAPLELTKRDIFLQRVAARLRLTGARHPTDGEVGLAVEGALVGLLQGAA